MKRLIWSSLFLSAHLFVQRIDANPIDALEAKCDNEKKAELGQAFVECANNGIVNLAKELAADRNKKPWETDYCIKYEEAMDCMMLHPLVSECFPDETTYHFEALMALRYRSTQTLSDFGHDPAYLANCTYFEEKVPEAVMEMWLESIQGKNRCPLSDYFSMLGRGLTCDDQGLKLQNTFMQMMAASAYESEEEIIAAACEVRNKWVKHCGSWALVYCMAQRRIDGYTNWFMGQVTQVLDTTKKQIPSFKWKKDCRESMLKNPRNQEVLDATQYYRELKQTMPLDDFNTKKCKGKALKTQALAMDKCMFGEQLADLTEAIMPDKSGKTPAIADTKFCKHVEEIVKCAQAGLNKCFGKKALKDVTEMYMGIIAFAATQRLGLYNHDPGYLAQCAPFKSIKAKDSKKWIKNKTGQNKCDLAKYYTELGKGVTCDIKSNNLYNFFIRKLSAGAYAIDEQNVDKEKIIADACKVRKHIIQQCQGKESNTCLDQKKSTWLDSYRKNPIKVLFNFLASRIQEGFKWKKDCP